VAVHEITDRALDTAAARGASYADVRVVRRRQESIDVKTGRLAGVLSHETEGFGVRVLVDGAWGFASSHRLAAGEADRVAAEAIRIARASATATRHPVVLDDRVPARGSFETPIAVDPFAIPLEHKVGELLAADAAMRRVRGVAFTDSTYGAQRDWTTFAATDGSFTEQVITHTGAGIEANAVDGDEHQRRSYPDAGGAWQGAGYEHVRGLDLAGTAERVASEAVQLLSAPQLPPGRRTIVLHPSQLYLQVHESCGHPTELDRVFGTEASYAGTSFLTTDKLESGFRYGSEIVDIVADATAPGGMGTFGWDDEGVAAQAVPLVSGGVFVGYLSSRETAPRIGRRSGGAMRADGWNRIPLIRMTNVNLLPKPGMSLDDIIADTDDGLFLAHNRSWSIDDRRLNFQFATELAYDIRGGKLGQLYRNATYTGITPEFWGSCDAIGDESSYVMLGTANCGKGEPGQVGHVGHGCSGARFRDVRVGVMR
jgi:TldD protein